MRSIEITGPMAVGKTTLIRLLANRLEKSEMILEDAARVNEVFLQVWNQKQSAFNTNLKQMLFLADFMRKCDAAASGSVLLIDRGVQDYLYFWQQSIGNLSGQGVSASTECLRAVERDIESYKSDILIYLAASEDTLRQRRDSDQQRRRGFFETYYPGERTYFEAHGARVFETDSLSPEELCEDILGVLTV